MNATIWGLIISAIGLCIGGVSFWKSHKKDKIQLKVTPQIYRHLERGCLCSTRIPDDMSVKWDGLCVEIINVGFVAATIKEIGLKIVENGEDKFVVFPDCQIPVNEHLPKRLEPKTSITCYIPSNEPQTIFTLGLPFAKCFYVTTACGLTINANSKVTKWLIAIGKNFNTSGR